MRLTALFALAFATLSAPAFADETTGTIVAYDRLSNVLVLDDKTVWTLDAKTLVPADLKAGDDITLTFQSDGDNGAKPATALVRN
ncbi:hypothetical protein [Loktanella sp. SALINAS62]|uniref:hypothetical protein n=1 Tax=Loktanella sp. SALINAS62 TaxID=2706124 RepID=UPI001B8B2F37|nr:hypothetical protein [Loktanella sp. SALINAS62]MBS1303472.1 hypothetical protein [Loktanella sp. SALINAS62]